MAALRLDSLIIINDKSHCGSSRMIQEVHRSIWSANIQKNESKLGVELHRMARQRSKTQLNTGEGKK